jgi:hypothetical protein
MIQVLKPLCHNAEQVGVDLLTTTKTNSSTQPTALPCFRYHMGLERLQINLDCANLAILMDDPS